MYWWKGKSPHRDCDMVIADGAIRSGKTVAMVCGFLQWSQECFDGRQFIIAGKSIGALKRNVVTPMLQILETWGWDYNFNRSENFIDIGTNRYYLFGANNEASQDIIQGMTAAGALADDAALFPQSFIDQMIGRCSIEGAKVWLNCNPRGPFHYLKTLFIDKAKKKHIYYLHFTMDDNLSLSDSIKERYRRMFSGVFFKRYILGLWVRAEGVIYDMFNEKKHVKTVDPKTLSDFWVTVDYGTQNPTVFLLWGRDSAGRWWCFKEYYHDGRSSGKQKTDEEYYEDLVKFVDNLPVNRIVVDPSAASFIATIKKHNRYSVRKARNAVLDGIRRTGTALTSLLIGFDESCTRCIQEMYAYVWDDKAVERGEDAPLKQDDHCLDAVRYFVNTVIAKSGVSVLT